MVGTTAALPLKFGGRISDPPGIGEPVPPPTSYRSVRHHVTTATIGPFFPSSFPPFHTAFYCRGAVGLGMDSEGCQGT